MKAAWLSSTVPSSVLKASVASRMMPVMDMPIGVRTVSPRVYLSGMSGSLVARICGGLTPM